jgi:hypothetical protein
MKLISKRVKRGGRPGTCAKSLNMEDCNTNPLGCVWNSKTGKCSKKKVQAMSASPVSRPAFDVSGEIDITIGSWNLYIPEDNGKLTLFENPGQSNRRTYTVPINSNWNKLKIVKPSSFDPEFEESIIEFDLFYFRVSNSGIFELTFGMEYTLFAIKIPIEVANLIREVLHQKSRSSKTTPIVWACPPGCVRA